MQLIQQRILFVFGIYQPYRIKNRHTVDVSGSDMDGSFTTAVSNLLVDWWFWV